MKLVIPNMIWHGDRERVLTIAFHPFLNQVVTGGSDSEKPTEQDEEMQDDIGYIKIWEMLINCQFKFIGALSSGHSATVNCIKFSSNGRYMASGSDDKKIIIWERRLRNIRIGSNEQKLTWCETKPLFGHSQEVYDLSWSRDCKYLASASLDKMVNVWNVEKGKLIQTLDGHTSYVQGVVFDPKMKFIISMSQDRTAKVWKSQKAKTHFYYQAFSIRKVDQKDFSFKLFLDENVLFTFVRRPDFSPDGSLFILPAAQYQKAVNDKTNQVGALVFLRCQPQTPALFINTNSKPAIAVKFCPTIFKKDQSQNDDIFDLPYKMVFAIATIDQVIIYSTQSLLPIAIFGNMHYASITDLSFKGSQILGVSSCDGFCSFIQIAPGELGVELPLEEMEEELRALMVTENYYEMLSKQQLQKVEQQATSPNQNQNDGVQEQKIILTETADGGKKKVIVPKMIQQL